MAKLSFTVPGPPQGKGRPQFSRRSQSVYTPSKTVAYEESIRWCYRAACGGRMLSGSLNLSVLAVYPIPASWSFKRQKKAADGELLPCVKPDFDNVMKVVADALNKVAYKDDCQITDQQFSKRYGEFPRLVIELEEVQ